MKVGILTQPLHSNYGGLLQNFALQSVIKKMGHEVLTVDIPIKRPTYIKQLRIILGRIRMKFFLKRKNYDSIFFIYPNRYEEEIINQHTNKFIKNHIHTTEKLKSVKEISKLKQYEFDAYIVGSDQVWRPMFSPGLLTYFLNFLHNNEQTKRIAYAASFGVDTWEFPDDLTRECRKLARRFDAISVRECSGVELCENKLNVKATHVLDPTLLLEKEDYELLIENNTPQQKGKILTTYILDNTPFKQNIICDVEKLLNLKVHSLTPSRKYVKRDHDNINEYVFCSMSEWLSGFRDADFIITDSFHGTVFSILFNKPFFAIGNKERGLTRFFSLLKLFDIESRLIVPESNLTSKAILTPINYKVVNDIRKQHKTRAFHFLHQVLGGELLRI